MICSSSVDSEYSLVCWNCSDVNSSRWYCISCMSCVIFDCLDSVFNSVCVCDCSAEAQYERRGPGSVRWEDCRGECRRLRHGPVASLWYAARKLQLRRAGQANQQQEVSLSFSQLCGLFFFFLYQYRYFLWSAPAHHKNIIKTPHCFGNVRCQIWPVAWTLILALTSSFALTSFSHDSLKTTTDSAANELKEYTIHSYIVALVTYMYSIAHYYVKCYMHTYFLH